MQKTTFAPLAAVLGLLAFGVGPLLASAEILSPFVGFRLSLAGAALALVGFVAGLVLRLRGTRRGGVGKAIVLGILPAAVVAWTLATAADAPLLNDVTTDPDAPLRFRAVAEQEALASADLDFPPDNAPLIREAWPDLGTLHTHQSPGDTFRAATKIAQDRERWTLHAVDRRDGRIEGTARSRVFGFRDDFVIEISPADGGARVDMRSRSRVGTGDMGANAERIRRFLDDLETGLGGG